MNAGQLARIARIARTAAHVPPAQAARWAGLRAMRALAFGQPPGERRRGGASALAPPLAVITPRLRWVAPRSGRPTGLPQAAPTGWPVSFRPLDSRPAGLWPTEAELRTGKITLLGVTRDLDGPAGWRHADAPRLWRFHLHYWDWAWGLAGAADPDRTRELFARLWAGWTSATRYGTGDAWHPYPAALRAWAWCGLYRPLAAGGEVAPRLAAALAAHAAFLRRNTETDVAGNHLIKSLKALFGLAVFDGDDRAAHQALHRLARQARTQVLADGGHRERSPAYHCQVLADLIDVSALAETAGILPPSELTTAIARMRRWLGAVLGPDGEVPMLGDGYPVPRQLVAALRPAPPGDTPLVVLPSSGLARLAAGGWHMLADAGCPGRWDLAAHAHAGTLGCLVHADGVPVLVDTATSTYEPGPTRDYERSTAAHNTVEVDGTDSTEVWGGFRVGRRPRVRWLNTRNRNEEVTCAAVHDGYRHLPGRPLHRRRWSVAGGCLSVSDLVAGHGRHSVVLHWHLAPGTAVRVHGASAAVTTGVGEIRLQVAASAPVLLSASTRPVAVGFGLRVDTPVLTCRVKGQLPLRVTTVFARGEHSSEEAAT